MNKSYKLLMSLIVFAVSIVATVAETTPQEQARSFCRSG